MPQEKDIVLKMFSELAEFERHFNQLQHNYRLLCSTWILGAFTAFGFIFAMKDTGTLLPREILIVCVSIAAAAGATLLWILDLRVYHQLLDCCFVEGLELERENPWLPQIRTKMLETQAEHGVLNRVVWFYVVSVLLVLAIGGSVLTLFCYRYGAGFSVLAGILWLAGMIVWAMILKRFTTSHPITLHRARRPNTALEPTPTAP